MAMFLARSPSVNLNVSRRTVDVDPLVAGKCCERDGGLYLSSAALQRVRVSVWSENHVLRHDEDVVDLEPCSNDERRIAVREHSEDDGQHSGVVSAIVEAEPELLDPDVLAFTEWPEPVSEESLSAFFAINVQVTEWAGRQGWLHGRASIEDE